MTPTSTTLLSTRHNAVLEQPVPLVCFRVPSVATPWLFCFVYYIRDLICKDGSALGSSYEERLRLDR